MKAATTQAIKSVTRSHRRRQSQHLRFPPPSTSSSTSTSTSTCRPFTTSSPYHASSSSSSKEDSSSSSSSSSSSDGPVNRSPFEAFMQVLREESRKHMEFQENVKQLQGKADQVKDSEAVKAARRMYERARLAASIQENPRLRAAAEQFRKQGGKVGDAVNEAVKAIEENRFYRTGRDAIYAASTAVSEAAMTATAPIRDTETYKAVAESVRETIDDVGSNMRYGGYLEKEDRRRRRLDRLRKAGKGEGGLAAGAARVKVDENPEAGSAVILSAHQAAPEQPSFASRLNSMTPEPVQKFFSNMSESYENSDNPLVASLRSVTSSMNRLLFEETELAKVIKWSKGLDPSFQLEGFLRDLREYIVPEVVDAFVSGDVKALKMWCSEATYNVLTASITPMIQKGLVNDSRILDIRAVDYVSAKILENDIPVYVISFRTQEIICFRDPKTGEIVAGKEDKIEQVVYVAVVTRLEEELENEITGGWKFVDMARRAAA